MINNIINFSIKNKPIIGLLTIALIIGGFFAMTKVPVDALPDITNNQVLVITTAPNLGTEDIEQFVTYPVELAVANLPDVTEIRSVSRFGLSVVTIVFKESAGTYLPRQLVNEALAEAKEKIPEGFGSPFMAPVSTGLGEIYQYTLEVAPGYEDKYDDMELRTIQDWIIKRQMAMLPGVVEVNSFGGRGKQYEVAVNPDKLKSMGLTINDIYKALKDNNQNVGGAYIEKNHQANFIRGEGLMRSLDDIKNTLVKNINGQPIFIRDVAKVQYGNFLRYGAFTKNGKGEAVGGIVMMLKGANSNEVIKNVKKRVAQIQKSLPAGIKIKPFLDRSKLIKNTTTTVVENLLLGAIIVILVLVLFLGNVRGGLIVASVIPLALLFSFIMMKIFGVWANLMSMGALDFGILVDGAVIIVEAMIFYLYTNKYIGKKLAAKDRDEIAFKSASKMMNSAFFGQLIILIVFIPVLALQGVEGKMFIPMAMTFGFAIIGVMILSLTYVPMMAALLLQPPKNANKSWGEKIIEKLENFYLPVLDWALRHTRAVLGFALALLLLGGYLFTQMGAEFIPKLDEGDFAFQEFYKPGTALSEVMENTTKIEKAVLDNFPDEIESIQSRVGVANIPMDPMPMDIADVFVILKPKSQWKKAKTKQELIEKIEKVISMFPGINFEFTQPIEMRFNELLTGVREDIAIKLYGDDLNVLADKAQKIAKLVAGINGVGRIKVEATRGLPQITVHYNRQKLGQYNLKIKDLNKIIATAFSGQTAGQIYEGERMFDLVVRLGKQHRKSIEDLKNLYVNLPGGQQIPLKTVADISYRPGPMQIGRENTNRRTYVGVNVRDRDVKSLVDEIQSLLDKKLDLPAGYYVRYGGAFENLQRATKRLSLVVPLALALIFILVFFAVKSFKQTLMIYLAVPFAAVGGILALYLRDMPFSISAGVGFIVLFGVAVLNGLVLISSFNELKQKGIKNIDELIKKGAVRRLRPIFLTASTDILGFLPMAISNSAGAEVQRPLATVVIGGMITSTILTLIVLPVLYKLVETGFSWKNKFSPIKLAAGLFFLFFLWPVNKVIAQQQPTTLDDQTAIEIAIKKYPSIKAAELEIKRQRVLKNTIFDIGETEVFTGQEEVSPQNVGVQNNLGFNQSGIALLQINAQKKLWKAGMEKAKIKADLTKAQLIKEVSIAWYTAYYAQQRFELYKNIDTLYHNFVKAAQLKFKTGETAKIAYLSALSQYRTFKIKQQEADAYFKTSLYFLNQYLGFKKIEAIKLKLPEKKQSNSNFMSKDFKNGLLVRTYQAEVNEAEAKWKTVKKQWLPKFNLGFKKQSIDGVPGFKAWEVGMSLPLNIWSVKSKAKAAKMSYQIAEAEMSKKIRQTQTFYLQLLTKKASMLRILHYYETEAIPLADEQIEKVYAAYLLGDIDYIQFIQNIQSAIKIKLAYLKKELDYQQIVIQLNYLLKS